MVLFPGHEENGDENQNYGAHWVIHYRFDNTDCSIAIEEFRELIGDLDVVGLQTEVRHGNGASLLIFVRAPKELLGNCVYKSRVKDWLWGISHVRPVGDGQTVVDGETEAEELRSIIHLVTWRKDQGSAGITANFGKWKNVKASFSPHNQAANRELLWKWRNTTILTAKDFDAIRAVFGEKIALYIAFMQCYALFLTLSAAFSLICWMCWDEYSIKFAVINCLSCLLFVEYWKMRESDLSIGWGVKGVGVLKFNRIQYIWDKEITDPITGEIKRVSSARKQILRQFPQLPFAVVSSLTLGALIVITFALEVFISEAYPGSLKAYLSFMPTILFSLFLPTITSYFIDFATRLTNYENHRTEDLYELAQALKTFGLTFIISFLPIFLTAFVYVPFGRQIISFMRISRAAAVGSSPTELANLAYGNQRYSLLVRPARLQREVVCLSVSAQVLTFSKETILPYIKRFIWRKYLKSKYQKLEAAVHRREHSDSTTHLLVDRPEEAAFLTRIRDEAETILYDVHDNLREICMQFGYLSLFGIAWPLASLGFLVYSWVKLRIDLFKLSTQYQRPNPIRADTIGPWIDVLSFLTWLGTLSTTAIVHLYRNSMDNVKLWSVLLTILVAEQAYLAARFLVRAVLRQIGSENGRREAARRYAARKCFLETFSEEAADLCRRHKPRVRFNEITDVLIASPRAPFADDEEAIEGGFDIQPDGIAANHCSKRLRRPLKKIRNGTLWNSETSELWFWRRTSKETADAGVKLIRALTQLDPSQQAIPSLKPETLKVKI